jgi:hypothetical protein
MVGRLQAFAQSSGSASSVNPRFRTLVCQAVGAEPAHESNWEALQAPETDLLPSVLARIDSSATSSRAKGLKRYTWLRYQLALSEARNVASLAPEELVLMDDLHLSTNVYSHPSARVLYGIDFLVRPQVYSNLEEQLPDLGWSKPSWPDGPDYQEWRGPDELRLRFHSSWLEHDRRDIGPIFQRARDGAHDLLALAHEDQLVRTCWRGHSHLWLVDAWNLRARLDEMSLPRELASLGRRWNRLCCQTTGRSLELTWQGESKNLAQLLLGRCHRRGHPYTDLVEQLAMELVTTNQAGWPGQWMRRLCERWALESSAQVPLAFWHRWRGDSD